MDIFFYICVAVCAFIAGMGIGGGSIFLLVGSIFSLAEFRDMQIFNLIMFISVGISTAIYSIKNKNIDYNIFKKIIFFIIIGSICGSYVNKIVDIDLAQKIFLIFMILLGSYEIISSFKKILQGKINKMRGVD